MDICCADTPPPLQTMKVRLQSPSGTELAPFNPILPPAAITQVMLLANPLKVAVILRLFYAHKYMNINILMHCITYTFANYLLNLEVFSYFFYIIVLTLFIV